MENKAKFDELIKEMEEANGGLIGKEQQPKRPVSRRMILELIEWVESAKTEEELDAIVKRFFKDVHNGKLPLHEQVQVKNRNQGAANAIQLPEMMRDTLRRCLNEFLRGVEDLKTSLERIEVSMRDLEPILYEIGNFRSEKQERMRGMISALLKLGYSEADIKELTKSGKKYSSGISKMEGRDDEPQY